MNPYGRSREYGGHFFVKKSPPYPDPVRQPLRPLNDAELATVAQNKALVCTHMPEMVPIIKELHECGLIDGWRSVVKVVVLKEGAK